VAVTLDRDTVETSRSAHVEPSQFTGDEIVDSGRAMDGLMTRLLFLSAASDGSRQWDS
jgi:hypothetical protein